MFGLYSLSFLSFALAAQTKWTPPPEYALEISKNGLFLQEPSGKPFFWQADTAWLLTHHLNYTEAEEYLADRASKGYNIILNVGLTMDGIDSPNRYGDLTFHDLDVTKPNEPYWSFIDDVVQLAWERYHIRMCLVPSWGSTLNRAHLPANIITAENGEAFGSFIGERYPYLPKTLFGDTNPLWADDRAIETEYAAGGIPNQYPSTDFSAIYDAVARGIVAGERTAIGNDEFKPLLTIHLRNQWMLDAPIGIASAYFGDLDWFTYDTAQSGHADTPPHPPIPWWNARRGYETVQAMWNASKIHPVPVIDNEPHYERRWSRKANPVGDMRPWNASDVRIGTWQTAFAGAAGITYGNDNIWHMYVQGITEDDESGITAPWNESIHDPGAGQMQWVQKAILDRARFFERLPAQDVIVGDQGKDDKRVMAIRDNEWSWIMVYTPTGQPFTIDTSKLQGDSIRSFWMNPLDGEYEAFDSPTLEGTVKFEPPNAEDHTDWTLVLAHERKRCEHSR